MAASGGHKRVHFDVQAQGAYAVQLRLTPALLEALHGQEADQAATICFGEGPHANAIVVGDTAFRFNALPEESCDLLHLAPGGTQAPAIVGAVRQKLMVHRNIADERERVRARAEEAERKGAERKAMVLQVGRPVKSGVAQKARKMVQRVTPPPTAAPGTAPPQQQQQGRGATPPPRQQLTASMLAAPTGKPPAHPAPAAGAAAAGRGPTPPPGGASEAAKPAARPMHKSASAGKLGGKASSAANLGSLQLAASQLVVAAARKGSVRLCLIAILAERPMGMNIIKAVLADAAAKVKAFKMPSKEQLERHLKNVAEFKSPGVYHVYPVLLKELDPLAPGVASAAVDVAPHQQAAGEGADDEPPASRARKKRASSAAPALGTAPAPATGQAAGDGAQRRPVAVATTGKRGRLDWTDDDDSDLEPAQPPAQRMRAAPAGGATHVHAVVPRASASPPSISGGPTGASSGSGGAPAGLPLRRSSSSRGSDHADESWIEEHADRQPEAAAPIASKEEYHRRAAAFNSRYEVYFRLHQLIEAHKKDFEALDAAIRGAASEAERDKHRGELERLYQRRGERAKRWDAAYRVLHQELAAAKARMAEFVQQLQGQPPHGAAPAPAAAVRVK